MHFGAVYKTNRKGYGARPMGSHEVEGSTSIASFPARGWHSDCDGLTFNYLSDQREFAKLQTEPYVSVLPSDRATKLSSQQVEVR